MFNMFVCQHNMSAGVLYVVWEAGCRYFQQWGLVVLGKPISYELGPCS